MSSDNSTKESPARAAAETVPDQAPPATAEPAEPASRAATPSETTTALETEPEAGPKPEAAPDAPAEASGGGSRWRRAARHPGAVATLTWLVTLPIAFALPSALDANPFTQQDADLPLAALFAGAIALVCVAVRWRGPAVIGMTAGLFASYIALVLRTALSGTPFGHEGVFGDTGRLSAMAMRYTVTWASSDGIVEDVASEYPPLFPYVIGKTALLLDVPAWRLVGPAMVVAVSASVVVGFVLWSRLVAPAAALPISAWVLLAFGAPHKAYEVLALAIVVPLALTILGRPPRGRLHWLPAGLITAALCLTYYAYVAFAAIGLVILGWTVWRAADDRRAYLLYLARVTAVVAVATSWYTVPYLWAMLNGGQQIADTYQHRSISQIPFPFLRPSLIAVVQLGGIAGLLWYSKTAWWARPLLFIITGCYAYYAISMLRWVLTGHTGLLYYSMPLISACLLAGAVLSLREFVPALARRMRRSFAAGSGVAVMAITLVAGGFAYWTGWMPAKQWAPTDDGGDRVVWSTADTGNRYAAQAHYQYLPDGSRPKYAGQANAAELAPGTWRYLPVTQIERAVREVRPRDERPRVLSYDEQIYAFLPWRGYMGVERVASYAPVRWEDRHDTVNALSKITDPVAFARATAGTEFGAIDVFVLRAEGDAVVWRPLQLPTSVRFTRAQFASSFVVTDLPDGTVVATRRS